MLWESMRIGTRPLCSGSNVLVCNCLLGPSSVLVRYYFLSSEGVWTQGVGVRASASEMWRSGIGAQFQVTICHHLTGAVAKSRLRHRKTPSKSYEEMSIQEPIHRHSELEIDNQKYFVQLRPTSSTPNKPLYHIHDLPSMVCQSRIIQPRMASSPTAPPSSSASNLPSDPSNKSDDGTKTGWVLIGIILGSLLALLVLLCILRCITKGYLSRRIRRLRQTTPIRSEAEIATLRKWKDTYTLFRFLLLGLWSLMLRGG